MGPILFCGRAGEWIGQNPTHLLRPRVMIEKQLSKGAVRLQPYSRSIEGKHSLIFQNSDEIFIFWDLSEKTTRECVVLHSDFLFWAMQSCSFSPSFPCIFSCSREEAGAIEKELLEEFRFGHQQLIEIWGHACAMAVTKVSLLQLEEGGGWVHHLSCHKWLPASAALCCTCCVSVCNAALNGSLWVSSMAGEV